MRQTLKTIAIFAGTFAVLWSAQHQAVIAGARYATTYCIASHLVELRQMTRLIEARNKRRYVIRVTDQPTSPHGEQE